MPLKEPFHYIRIKNWYLKFEAENMSIWAEARFNSFSVREFRETDGNSGDRGLGYTFSAGE